MEYLKSLHDTYEDWLIKGQIGSITNGTSLHETELQPNINCKATSSSTGQRKQRVIVIDGNKGVEEVAQECKARLVDFMKEVGHEGVPESKIRENCNSDSVDILA